MIRTVLRGAHGHRLKAAGLILLPVLATVSIALDAAPKAKLASEWTGTPIVVDGTNAAWSAFASVDKDLRLSMAAKNDDQYLYLALVTSDAPTALQVLNQGLIVWFDVEGGTRKRLGIQYPMGRGTGVARDPQGEQPPDPEAMWRRRLADNRLLLAQLLGPGKEDNKSLVLDLSQPIRAMLGHSQGTLIYELAVPLARAANSSDGLGARPGAVIGIGIETPERKDTPAAGRGVYGGGAGGDTGGRGGYGGTGGRGGRGGYGGISDHGGYGGGGVGGRGGAGGRETGASAPTLKPLKIWTTVQLATPPAAR
jgi:hypothetical protein